MKKIDILIPLLSGKGGTETVLKIWMQWFDANKNYDVNFIFSQGIQSQTDFSLSKKCRVNHVLVNNKFLKKIYSFFWLASYIRNSDAKIFICLSTKLVKIAFLVKKIFKLDIVIISWIHFSLDDKYVNKNDLLLADYHFSISLTNKDKLIALGVDESRICYIGNPIQKQSENVSASVNGVTSFVYIGRLIYNYPKNIKILLKALMLIEGDWKLDIYGDGEDFDKIENIIGNSNLKDRVTLKGWINDPWSDIVVADCLLLTSLEEGFGMVLAEAISRGVPCISSDCPVGPPEIINDSNGILFRSNNLADLSAVLQNFVDAKYSFTPNIVKKSIENFYISNYFEIVIRFLDLIK